VDVDILWNCTSKLTDKNFSSVTIIGKQTNNSHCTNINFEEHNVPSKDPNPHDSLLIHDALFGLRCIKFWTFCWCKKKKHSNLEVYLLAYDSLPCSAASLLKDQVPSKCWQQQTLPWHLQTVAMLGFLIYCHLHNLILLLW